MAATGIITLKNGSYKYWDIKKKRWVIVKEKKGGRCGNKSM
jgi:hypothetical protein